MAKLTQAELTAIVKAVVDGSKQSIDSADYELTADTITGLIEKIARVEVADPEVVDTLDIFDAGQLESGADIELAFNELLAPEDADPTGATALAPRYPALFKSYSKPLGVKDFVGTMPKLTYRKVLEGFLPIEEFASKVVSNIRKSKVAYKYAVKRQALAQMRENAHQAQGGSNGICLITEMSKPTDETSSKAFVKRILEKISDFKFISQENNCAGVLTSVSSTNVVVILRKDIMPTLSVMLYAGLRSPQYAGINVEIREVDNFGTMQSDWDTNPDLILACITDVRAMRLFTISDYTEEQLNAKGSFKTWFNHYDANLCLHPCANYHFIIDNGVASSEVVNINIAQTGGKAVSSSTGNIPVIHDQATNVSVMVANTSLNVEVDNTPLEVEVVEPAEPDEE